MESTHWLQRVIKTQDGSQKLCRSSHETKNENRNYKVTMIFIINYQFHVSQHTLSREMQWKTHAVTSCSNFGNYYFEQHGCGSRPGYHFFWDLFDGSFHSFDQSEIFTRFSFLHTSQCPAKTWRSHFSHFYDIMRALLSKKFVSIWFSTLIFYVVPLLC